MRGLAVLSLAILLQAGGVKAQDDVKRTDMIVGSHPGGPDQLDYGHPTIKNYVSAILQTVRYSVDPGSIGGNTDDTAREFLSKLEVAYDSAAEPDNLEDLFQAEVSTLMLMAGVYSARKEEARSTIFLGDHEGNFNLSQTTAEIFTHENFANGSNYFRIVMAYAIIREADRRGLEPRAVARPLALEIEKWANELEEAPNFDSRSFPHLRVIVEDVLDFL